MARFVSVCNAWFRGKGGRIMMGKRLAISLFVLAAAGLLLAFTGGVTAQDGGLAPVEQLGKMLFFDTNLSTPPGQACAFCHAPAVGFTGPDSAIDAAGAVYPGANTAENLFGNRKPPASAYANSPVLYYDEEEETWVGGMFWDGRATGWTLGDPLAEQAQGPFLNPLEQNNADAGVVCAKVAASAYADLFTQVWGSGSLDCAYDVGGSYERIARSIAAYERSFEVNPFSSKYDAVLAGRDKLSGQEKKGLRLFEGKAMCANCHISQPGPNGEPPLFTDFTYDNLGVPKNPLNPFYTIPPEFNPDGTGWIDYGLGGFLRGAGYGPEIYEPQIGKHKVPTLRNVDRRPYPFTIKAYGHNGYFKSLQSIVHFYNTRDALQACDSINNPKEGANCWPAPEEPMNMNREELGNLGLKDEEEAALVAFLRTLSDGYVPRH
jgi:cytochrome c peroxidase